MADIIVMVQVTDFIFYCLKTVSSLHYWASLCDIIIVVQATDVSEYPSFTFRLHLGSYILLY